jgi:hypothetical protein
MFLASHAGTCMEDKLARVQAVNELPDMEKGDKS